MPRKVVKSDEEWRHELTPAEFEVLRQKGTERAFTGEYTHPGHAGSFRCAGCGSTLFRSDEQFDSGSGWPSFWAPAEGDTVETERDNAYGMERTEVLCAACGGHLGHLFDDGPQPTGLRYCINSAALKLDPEASGT